MLLDVLGTLPGPVDVLHQGFNLQYLIFPGGMYHETSLQIILLMQNELFTNKYLLIEMQM